MGTTRSLLPLPMTWTIPIPGKYLLVRKLAISVARMPVA